VVGPLFHGTRDSVWYSSMTAQSLVLVVDDSPTQQLQIQMVLEADGYRVALAGDGLEALQAIDVERPDIVVTDLQMPNMNGLELVAELKARHPSIPVILATAVGSETIAAAALQKGASSYVPKSDLATGLSPIVQQVLSLSQSVRSQREISRCVQSVSLSLKIENDETLVPSVIARLEQAACEVDFCDEMLWMQIAMALDEALVNAIFHGNLEVSSDLRQVDDGKAFVEMVGQRKLLEPYQSRRVSVDMHVDREKITFVISDEGKGFNVAAIPDPTDPANLEKAGGRGLLLIHSFMDSVCHNAKGNQITMMKLKSSGQDWDDEDDDEEE
jgi:CheY-like chemotaxis protein/anti-sigma regulatory factor (Ser/Thr protein kinase)